VNLTAGTARAMKNITTRAVPEILLIGLILHVSSFTALQLDAYLMGSRD
jgi:hypothetical protein